LKVRWRNVGGNRGFKTKLTGPNCCGKTVQIRFVGKRSTQKKKVT